MSYSRRSDKVRTDAPIINPYDAFTQPEFDEFIGGLTDKIRGALDPRARYRNLDRSSDASLSYRDFSLDRSVSVGDSFRGGSVQSVPRSSVDTTREHYEDDGIKYEEEAQDFEEVDESPSRVASNLPKVVVSGAGDEESPFLISDTEEENGSATPPASRLEGKSRPVVFEEVEEDDELEEDVEDEELHSNYPIWNEEGRPVSIDDVEELGPAEPSFIFDEDQIEEEASQTVQGYSHEPQYHEIEDDDYSEENQLDAAEQLDEYIVAELDHLPPEDSFQELVNRTVGITGINSSIVPQRNDSPRPQEYTADEQSSSAFLSQAPHSTIPSVFSFEDHHSDAQYGGSAPIISHGITWPTPEFASTSAIGFYPGYPTHTPLTDSSEVIGEAINGDSVGDTAPILMPSYTPSESLHVPEVPTPPPIILPATQSSDIHEERPKSPSPTGLPHQASIPPTFGINHVVTSGNDRFVEPQGPVEPINLRSENIFEDYPETQSTTGESRLVETSQHDGSEAEPFVQDFSGSLNEKNQEGSSASTRSTTPVQPSGKLLVQEETITPTQTVAPFAASQATLGTPRDELWDSQRTFTFSDFPSRTMSIADDATLTPNTLDTSPFRLDRMSTMASDDYFASQSIRSVSQEAPSEPLSTQETLRSDVGQDQELKPPEAKYPGLLDDDSSLSELDEPTPVKSKRQNKNPRATRELKALQGADLALDLPPYRATRSAQSSPVVPSFSPIKVKGKGKSSPLVGSSAPKPARKTSSRTTSHSVSSRKLTKRSSKSPSKEASDDLEKEPAALETVEEEDSEEDEVSGKQSSNRTKRRRKARLSLMEGDDEDYLPEETERSLKKRRIEAHELDVEKSLDDVDLGTVLETAEAGAGAGGAQQRAEGVSSKTNRKRARSETPSGHSEESSTSTSSVSSDDGGSEFRPSVAGDDKDEEAARDGEDQSQTTEEAEGDGENGQANGKQLKKQARGFKLGLDGRLYKPSRESDEEDDDEEEPKYGEGLQTYQDLLEDVQGIAEGAEERLKELREQRRLKKVAERAEAKEKKKERKREKKEKAKAEGAKDSGGDKMEIEVGKGEQTNVGERKRPVARTKSTTGSRKTKKEKDATKSASVDPVTSPVGEGDGGSQTVKRPKQRTKKPSTKKKEEEKPKDESNPMDGVVATSNLPAPLAAQYPTPVQPPPPNQSSNSSSWPNIFRLFGTSTPHDSGMKEQRTVAKAGEVNQADGDDTGADADQMDVD
ncbi:hypothetical protein FRC20_010586 [Serendipita sp. 405]|nr:hypothetical protein FRC20_010586 [Serendipita sp. 405]